jgi:hypothetical protein
MRRSRWRSLGVGSGAAILVAALSASPALAAPSSAALSAVSSSSSTALAAAATAAAQAALPSTAASAATATANNASNCSTPQLSQTFLTWGDQNWYTFAPGESADNFAGNGWTLGNGANITTTTLVDGSTGSVLDLPTGGYAISPPVCVESNYPTARTMISEQSGIVGVAVTYAGLGNLQPSGIMTANGGNWAPSNLLQVHPGSQPGWQLVQFVFGYLGGTSAQLYNFGVDPWMSD